MAGQRHPRRPAVDDAAAKPEQDEEVGAGKTAAARRRHPSTPPLSRDNTNAQPEQSGWHHLTSPT